MVADWKERIGAHLRRADEITSARKDAGFCLVAKEETAPDESYQPFLVPTDKSFLQRLLAENSLEEIQEISPHVRRYGVGLRLAAEWGTGGATPKFWGELVEGTPELASFFRR